MPPQTRTRSQLTFRIDRTDRTWQDLVSAAAFVTEDPAATLVDSTLALAANSYLGMPWYMIPPADHSLACKQLADLVLGFEPWSLRSLLQAGKENTWLSTAVVSQLLQHIGQCSSELGEDTQGTVLTASTLLLNTSLSIKQRQRRTTSDPNACGATCTCSGCVGASCDGGCDVSVKRFEVLHAFAY